MKKFISLLTLSTLLFIPGCQSTEAPEVVESDNSLSVVASFYPLYFFVSEIVGGVEGVEVTNLIPSGGEPHSFEPSPSQMADMESADLILVQGAGLEPWFEGLEDQLERSGAEVQVINEELELMEFEEHHDDHEDEHDHEEDDHEDDHDHGEYDPHTWLDPILAIDMVEEIAEELGELDPENKASYQANAGQLIDDLQNLDAAFRAQLESCQHDAFITSHDAFGYLAARYDLHVFSAAGVSPFDEPSANQITELIEIADAEGVEHIYFEVLANSAAAEVLADEAGLESLVLNPIAGLSSDQNDEDYLSLMERNLNNLTIGLACE